ncbi:transposable element Tc1 transposase [Trichonephila clavipes]|nr:transposable element Tc1 transposase [Trichonephila clavipes]
MYRRNGRIACRMGRSDVAIRRCWQEWVDNSKFQRHDGGSQTRNTDREEVLSGSNHADRVRIMLRDEPRFQLCPSDNRRRVWRRLGQCVDSAFTVARHTGPQPAQQYADNILITVLLSFLLRYPSLICQQDTARPHSVRVVTNCLSVCQTLPSPARSLSNQTCQGYDGKVTTSNREC